MKIAHPILLPVTLAQTHLMWFVPYKSNNENWLYIVTCYDQQPVSLFDLYYESQLEVS